MPNLETLLVSAILAGATLPLVALAWRSRGRSGGLAAGALWLAGAVAMIWAGADYQPAARAARAVVDRPIEVPADGYLSSSACRSCHPEQYASWHDSYHRTMTQVASPATMLAPWPKAPEVWRFRFEQRDYAIQQRGEEYWVEMEEPALEGSYGLPARTWRKVVQITGAHHWQFFWYATGLARKVELFPFAWRVADTPRWMPLDGCCVSPPTHRQQAGVEAGTGRWTISCNKCHSTHGRPRVLGRDEFDTHVVELGIACEACHGPGAEHVARNQDPRRRYALHLSGAADDTIVDPSALDHVRSSQVCANCHSVTRFKSDADREEWNMKGYRFRPGDLLTDSRSIDLAGEDKFWSDGMIRVSGREYNGLLASPCYERGTMSCLSCHVMHQEADDPRPREEWAEDQLRPGMRGNLACTQCHAEYADEEYVAAHTRHAPGSGGSNCYDCHMPHTTYGLLKGIRSHQVSSPSVTASIETGRPNACNQCHLDRTLAWSAKWLEEWYGIAPPELSQEQREVAASILWATKGDAGQRALMAWSYGWEEARKASGTEWMTPFLGLMLFDPYHAVRYIAQRGMQKQTGFEHLMSGYDFARSIGECNEVAQRIFAAWSNGASSPYRRKDPELLVTPAGELRTYDFTVLLKDRDERPVVLNE